MKIWMKISIEFPPRAPIVEKEEGKKPMPEKRKRTEEKEGGSGDPNKVDTAWI